MYVPRSSITTTRLWKEVLSPSQCVLIQRGRCTLAGGKTPYTINGQATKTHFTPHSVLFGDVYTNQKELRHIQKRTASCDEGPRALETILRLDKGTICNYDRSCESAILEVAQEPQQMNSTMASGSTRIRLRNTTCSQQRKHSPRCTVSPSWS